MSRPLCRPGPGLVLPSRLVRSPSRAGDVARYFGPVDSLFLPVDLAGGWGVVRRRRLRSRFLACDRFRVFSRALSFGAMLRDLPGSSALILRCCGAACQKRRRLTADYTDERGSKSFLPQRAQRTQRLAHREGRQDQKMIVYRRERRGRTAPGKAKSGHFLSASV